MGAKAGYKTASGGYEQKVSIYVEYDTDTKKIKFGISHTHSKNINETSFETPSVSGTEGTKKETVRDLNTADGGTKPIDDKTAKNSSEFGLYIFTTDEEGNIVKTDLGTGGELNLGIFGVGAEAETSYRRDNNQNIESPIKEIKAKKEKGNELSLMKKLQEKEEKH